MIDLSKYDIIHHVYGGSIQHGTFVKDSDYDHRIIYVRPTVKILSEFTSKNKTSIHIISEDKKEDYNMTEVGNFFNQLSRSNPNAVEILFSRDVRGRDIFKDLKDVYMYQLFDPKLFCNACMGMSISNLSRFWNEKDLKHAIESLRVLCMAKCILKDGMLYMNVKKYDEYDDLFAPLIQLYKDPQYTNVGEDIIEYVERRIKGLKDDLEDRCKSLKEKEAQDYSMLNHELYKIRMDNLLNHKSN